MGPRESLNLLVHFSVVKEPRMDRPGCTRFRTSWRSQSAPCSAGRIAGWRSRRSFAARWMSRASSTAASTTRSPVGPAGLFGAAICCAVLAFMVPPARPSTRTHAALGASAVKGREATAEGGEGRSPKPLTVQDARGPSPAPDGLAGGTFPQDHGPARKDRRTLLRAWGTGVTDAVRRRVPEPLTEACPCS